MLSLLYLLVYLFAGCVIIRALLPAQRPQVRVWLGLSLGLLLLMWLPALLAFAVRFSLLGHMLALIPLAGITVAVWVTRDKTPARALDDKDRQLLILMACVAVPLTLLGGYLQYTHCLREINGTLHVGQSTYGDLPLHLGIITSLPRVFGVQSEHADPVYRYYAAPKDARVWQPVTVTPSVAQAAMIGNPVSFPRVQRLAEKFIEKGGEKAFQVVQVTEQQIMDAMIVANRHGHIACTQGGECLAGLVNARALGLVGDDEHAVLDATAHALKFSGFQDMYFNDSFPEAYGVKPQAELSNKPELLLPESAREGKDVATFARMGADAVVARLGLSRK